VSSALTPKPGRPRDPAKKLAGWNLPEAEDARELITGLGRSGRPIIVGPWLSETGFELLYWIPFLAWAKAYGNFDPEQLVIVSRGGAASWYRHISPNYEDILSFYTPDEFRQRNEERIVEQRGRLKHVDMTSFDREIIAKVSDRRGLRGVRVLHPSAMYALFDPFWFQRTPITLVEAFTSFAPMPQVDLGSLRAHLPDRFVAAKFYGNTALPDTPENHAFMASYLERLTEHTDVVLLNTGHQFDDHEDMRAINRKRLHTVDHLMTPDTNLDVQTRIIAAADAFVGTYGGFSYLAPLCGTDTLAFYSHVTGFRFDHLELAKRCSPASGKAPSSSSTCARPICFGLGSGEPFVKILFIARHFTYIRNFESVVAECAARGHDVCLAADVEETLGGRDLVDRLMAAFPDRVTMAWTPPSSDHRYGSLTSALRLGLDYLRYSDPRYEATPKIRERARKRTAMPIVALANLRVRGAIARLLERIEEAVPRPKEVDEFFASQKPDLVLITPLVELGSPQLDYVRAARRLGIPSALCVGSWDHLSSKALIRVVPDAIIVWNETQRNEADRFHGIPPERVIVTGAQCFDRWFDRSPASDRAAFCRRMGLDPDRPFILWVCSALFRGSPSESKFVHKWVDAIRRSPDPRLRTAGLLIRPHPQRTKDWQQASWTKEIDNLAVYGGHPIDEEGRADYFDSMFHSAAVVGLNTSAQVEAAIVDRPVFTILPPEFFENQEGTFHFHYLLTIGGGFLHQTRTLDEHVSQLAEVLAGGSTSRNRDFVEQFIRPKGVSTAATPVFVDAVEQLARRGHRAPLPTPAWVPLVRPVAFTLASMAHRTMARAPVLDAEPLAQVGGHLRDFQAQGAHRRAKLHDKRVRAARKTREQLVVRAKTLAKNALAGREQSS
jgi:hypothetical protein